MAIFNGVVSYLVNKKYGSVFITLQVLGVISVLFWVSTYLKHPETYNSVPLLPTENDVLGAKYQKSPVKDTLDLSSRGLTEVPIYALARLNLQVLDLSNNNISGILPAEINNLKELEVLNLSNNNLYALPDEIFTLKNLKELDLSGNLFTSKDVEFIRQGFSQEVNIIK